MQKDAAFPSEKAKKSKASKLCSSATVPLGEPAVVVVPIAGDLPLQRAHRARQSL